MDAELAAIVDEHEHTRFMAVLTDTRMSRDLKLLAACTGVYLTECRQKDQPPKNGQHWLIRVGQLARPDLDVVKQRAWVWSALRDDYPFYAPTPLPDDSGCTQTKTGEKCGKPLYEKRVERHPLTGVATEIADCTGHWSHEERQRLNQQANAWMANGRREPEPNHGGVFASYFPLQNTGTAGWARWYAWSHAHVDDPTPGSPFTAAAVTAQSSPEQPCVPTLRVITNPPADTRRQP